MELIQKPQNVKSIAVTGTQRRECALHILSPPQSSSDLHSCTMGRGREPLLFQTQRTDCVLSEIQVGICPVVGYLSVVLGPLYWLLRQAHSSAGTSLNVRVEWKWRLFVPFSWGVNIYWWWWWSRQGLGPIRLFSPRKVL